MAERDERASRAPASYVVPRQDLRIDVSVVPTLPASGFVVSDVAW